MGLCMKYSTLKKCFIAKMKLTAVDVLVLKWVVSIVVCWFALEFAVFVQSGLFSILILLSVCIATFLFLENITKLIKP